MSRIEGRDVTLEYSLDGGETFRVIGELCGADAVDFAEVDEAAFASLSTRLSTSCILIALPERKIKRRKDRQPKPFWARKENGA